MKLLHVTNIVSPHQMPLARCLVEKLGASNYRYAASASADRKRTAMGWKCDDDDEWILRVDTGRRVEVEYRKWWAESDVVLCGDRAIDLMEERLGRGKLTLYMSERWWKPPLGMFRLAHPIFAAMASKFAALAENRLFHYLPIGLYAARDMARWAKFTGRTWLWGYFTAQAEVAPPVAREGGALHVLYAGRMLGLKSLDTLVRSFAVVRDAGLRARLSLIGDGPERSPLERLCKTLGLGDVVCFDGTRSMEEVWKEMSKAHVFVLPSNGYEGWGAVVNEAMAQGCAVVASSDAGSAKTMIRDARNGLLFQNGDWQSLGRLLCLLAEDEGLRWRLGSAGQRTAIGLWSPRVAATRLVDVCQSLVEGSQPPSFADGPMMACGK